MKHPHLHRRLPFILTAGIILSLTVGCNGRKMYAPEREAQKLIVWARNSTASSVKAAARKYNETHSDVTVEVVEQPSTEMADQLSLAFTANEAPDIVAIDCTKVPYFISIGAFTDISSRYEALEFTDEFSPGMKKTCQMGGSTYAVPFISDVSVLLYNKDHYLEAGLDPEHPPATWDELITYSQMLTTEEHYGYVYAGDDAGAYMFTFMPYVWNNGGEFLSADGKTCEINSENAKEALQLLYDLTNTYQVTPSTAPSYTWAEAQDAFLLGKASQIVLGSAAVYNFVNGTNDMNWGCCLIPKGPHGTDYAAFSGGDAIGITSQCENVDAAWDFIEYALTDDVQIEEFARGGLLPARISQFDNPYFENTPQYQVLRDAFAVGHTPFSLRYEEIYDPLLIHMQNCLTGKTSPEEALTAIQTSVGNIIR